MRVLTVTGRPSELARAATVSVPLRERCEEILVDAGAGRDPGLADALSEEAGVSVADRPERTAASGAESTGAVMTQLEPLVAATRPDRLVVHGDSGAALAASLVGAKAGVPVIRPEAGARTFDRAMPEEVSRVVSDALASVRLCPTDAALANLRREGLDENAAVVGDLSLDTAALVGPIAESRSKVLETLGLDPRHYSVALVRRRLHLGTREGLDVLLALLGRIATESGDPVVLPIPARIHSRLDASGERDRLRRDGLALIEPIGHLDAIRLLVAARLLITDSSELQREAFTASVPAITLATATPWPETVETGWNRASGLDPGAVLGALAELPPAAARSPAESIYGGGGAGERTATAIAEGLG